MGQLGANAKKEEAAADSANADVKAIAKTTDGLQPPKLELPPKPEPKYRSPVEAFGSFAGLLAVVGGGLTRRPLLNSLNAAAGVMNAYRAQDEKAAQQQFETWKVETENAIKLADFQEKAYKDILEKANIDENTRLAMFATTARALGDENSAIIAEQHGLEEAKRLTMEQARLNQEIKLNAPKVAEAHLQTMALKDLTQSQKFKDADPPEKMSLIQSVVTPETFDQYKVHAAEALEKQYVAKGMPQAEAETKALEQIQRATSGTGARLTPDELSSYGSEAAAGVPLTQVVPGYSRGAVEQRTQVRDAAITKIMNDKHISPEEAGLELANRTIEYQAGKKSVGQLTTMLGATKQAVDQLDFNIEKTKEEIKKLGSSDLSPVINAIARGEEKWTGEPAYSALYYYMNATATESARLLSGGQASVAQLHAGAQDEAKKWANTDMTPASFDAVATAMTEEGRKRLQTFQDAIRYQSLGGGGSSSSPAPPPASSASAVPQEAIDMLKSDPSKAAQFDEIFGAGASKKYLQ
jgi:hypothetical protein